MKKTLMALVALALLASCKKEASKVQETVLAQVASDALLPLPCHSTKFLSDYPLTPGQQPPFTFTKTLYPDTRVNTLYMLSRAVPVHPAYKRLEWETVGHFAYTTNQGKFTGTKELWEYYKTPTGAGARRSVQKKNLSLTFNFNAQGFVQTVYNNYGSYDQYSHVYHPSLALNIIYGRDIPGSTEAPDALARIYILDASDEGIPGQVKTYVPQNDKYGNPLLLSTYQQPYNSGVVYTYDYTKPRNGKNYSFIPSQNLVSFEYNMCEVMQWLPQPTAQRTWVAGYFYLPDANHTPVTQGQEYKNYMFDSKGNQISLTYGDNVLQKTTWYCK